MDLNQLRQRLGQYAGEQQSGGRPPKPDAKPSFDDQKAVQFNFNVDDDEEDQDTYKNQYLSETAPRARPGRAGSSDLMLTSIQEEGAGDGTVGRSSQVLDDSGEDDDSDLSFVEQADAGPVTWEEVDPEDVQHQAVRLAQALSTSSRGAVGMELSVEDKQAPTVVQQDFNDPLGMGSIDPRSLSLVRSGGGGGAHSTMRAGQTLRTRLGQGPLGGQVGSFGRTIGNSAGRSTGRLKGLNKQNEMRLKVNMEKLLLTYESFSPELYLAHVHQTSSGQDLNAGLQHLQRSTTERTGQLKQLVKENFDRFLSCKHTIDDIHARLRRTEESSDGGRGITTSMSTTALSGAIKDVQVQAKLAFVSLLERQSRTDRIKSALEMLRRFSNLFQLPGLIHTHTENGDYEQLLSEYRKARVLMKPGGNSVWSSLFDEVNRSIGQVCDKLQNRLSDGTISSNEAIEALWTIAQLQSEGVDLSHHMNPVERYCQQQQLHTSELLQKTANTHAHEMSMLLALKLSAHGSPSRGSTVVPSGTVTRRADCKYGNAVEEATCTLVDQTLQIVCNRLPVMWAVINSQKLKDLSGVAPEVSSAYKEVLKQQLQGGEGSYISIIQKEVEENLERVFTSISQLDGMRQGIIRICSSQFQAVKQLYEAKAGSSVLSTLQDKLTEMVKLCINRVSSALEEDVVPLVDDQAKWTLFYPIFFESGDPISHLVETQGQQLCAGLDYLHQLLAATRIKLPYGTPFIPKNILKEQMACIRTSLFAGFQQFLESLDGLVGMLMAGEEAGEQELKNAGGIGMSGQRAGYTFKVLVILSNTRYCRQKLLPKVMSTYSGYLTYDDASSEHCRQLARKLQQDIVTFEKQLLELYLEAKQCATGVILHTVTASQSSGLGPGAPVPYNVRGCVHDVLTHLTLTQAQVMDCAGSQINKVMRHMVEHLCEDLKKHISDASGLSLCGLMQLYVDAMFLETAVKAVKTSGSDAVLDEMYEILLNQMVDMVQSRQHDHEVGAMAVLKGIKSPHDADSRMQLFSKEILDTSLQAAATNIQCFQRIENSPQPKVEHGSRGGR